MTYEQLIETVSLIIENEKIYKNGLILTYLLEANDHARMNQTLFYKSNPITDKFEPTDEFEVVLGGVLVKFIKEK